MKFRHFVAGINPEFFAKREILLDIADEMEAFYFDSSKKILNISMPPRFGKSYLATLFTVWLFIFIERKSKIMRICNTQELFNTFSKQTKQTFEDYSYIYDGVSVPTNGTIDKWYIDGSIIPNFFGAGISGNITGFGADIAIFDDMYKNYQDATSPSYDSFLNGYLQAVVFGRMEKNNYKIINIGTRWTTNDWFAKFTPDKEIIVQALTKSNKTICEHYKSTAELIDIKNKIADYLWSAQFMQTPTLQGRTKIFDIDKFNIIHELPKYDNLVKFQVIDPATDFGNDYFVVGTYLKNRGELILVDMWAKQGAKISEVAEYLKINKSSRIFIEVNGFGKEIMRRLRLLGVDNFWGFVTKTDKYNRAALSIDFIENNLSIFKHCDNFDLLMSQAMEFPIAEHDDLIDNVVMACENFRSV